MNTALYGTVAQDLQIMHTNRSYTPLCLSSIHLPCDVQTCAVTGLVVPVECVSHLPTQPQLYTVLYVHEVDRKHVR